MADHRGQFRHVGLETPTGRVGEGPGGIRRQPGLRPIADALKPIPPWFGEAKPAGQGFGPLTSSPASAARASGQMFPGNLNLKLSIGMGEDLEERYGIVPKLPISRLTVSCDRSRAAAHTSPTRKRGYFPFRREDLRQTSLTLRVGVERGRKCHGGDALNLSVLGRCLQILAGERDSNGDHLIVIESVCTLSAIIGRVYVRAIRARSM
jgi:hypothetical protein